MTTDQIETFNALEEEMKFSSDEAKESFIMREEQLRRQRRDLQNQYEDKEFDAKRKLKKYIYDNQKEAAFECMHHFMTGKTLVILIAQPGTGKTGTLTEIFYRLATNPDDELCVNSSNMHIISGMNDKDWRDQVQQNMLTSFQTNIYHRGVLGKKTREIEEIRNGIIACDECHIASGGGMTVSDLMKESGLTSVTVAKERQVRLLDISATPESVSWDIAKWGDNAAIVKLNTGSMYKGFGVMLEEKRILQAKSFEDKESVNEWFQFFEKRYTTVQKKYFPLRLSGKSKPEVIENLHEACIEFGWEMIRHDSSNRQYEIDEIMKTPPSNHTIILIKGFWRAAKRLERKHVGGTYEMVINTQNVSSTAQGLAGRFCDNYEYSGHELNPELRPVHFCDKDAIETYLRWFNSDCDYEKVDYTATRIKSKKGKVNSQISKIHSSIFTDLDESREPEPEPAPSAPSAPSEPSEPSGSEEPIVNKFDTIEEVKTYYNNVLKVERGFNGRGPTKRNPNEDGYYEATIRGNTRIYSCDEIFNERKWGFYKNKNNTYRCHPCYEDINDKTTLKWCLIHY